MFEFVTSNLNCSIPYWIGQLKMLIWPVQVGIDQFNFELVMVPVRWLLQFVHKSAQFRSCPVNVELVAIAVATATSQNRNSARNNNSTCNSSNSSGSWSRSVLVQVLLLPTYRYLYRYRYRYRHPCAGPKRPCP